MANNFQIKNAAVYVSKAGNDSNNGTTAETPKATFTAMMALVATLGSNFTAVVGAGTYEEAGTLASLSAASTCDVIADGTVVMKGANNALTYNLGAGTTTGFIFETYSQLTLSRNGFTNCLFNNVTTITNLESNRTLLYTNCIFINCSITRGNFNGCIFVNCTVNAAAQMINCYANGATVVNVVATIGAASFDYNNLMGTIRVGTDAAMTMDAHKAAYMNFNQHSFSAPPKFNNSAKLDFTLQVDSPHINAGTTGANNIGGTAYAQAYTAQSDIWNKDKGATLVGLELLGTDLVVSAGYSSGYAISQPIKIAANPSVIQQINYFGFLLFNKSQPSGSATNKNVPDAAVVQGADGSGGGSPDRLTYEMRWTDNDTQPAPDSEWLNAYNGPAGSFLKFEINKQPTVDNSGRGNGDPLFNNGASTPINNPVAAIWVQFKVTLTNSYV